MKKRFQTLAAIAALLIIPSFAYAKAGPLTQAQCNILGINCSGGVNGFVDGIVGIVNIALSLMALLAVIFIIYGGVLYIIAKGEEKELERAKYTILYALVGLIVIGLSVLIVTFILPALG